MRQEIIDFHLGILKESDIEYVQTGREHSDYIFHEEELKRLIDFTFSKGMDWAYKLVSEDLKSRIRGGDN